MKRKILYISLAVIVLALVIFRLVSNKKTTEKRVYQYDKEQPMKVQTVVLKAQPTSNSLTFSGVFEPNRESKLSAETPGKINVMYADEGSYVRRGQTLVKIDDALLRHQLQSVNVQIQSLEDDVKRFTILANADAIQKTQLDKAVLGLSTTRIQLNTLREQIAKTVIYAPFDGIITQKLSEVGAFAAPGIPLLQLTDINMLRFTVNVSENDLRLFRQGQVYTVKPDAFPTQTLFGRAIIIGSKGNLGSSFPVRFQVPNPGNKIKSGMFGKVVLGEATSADAIVVPSGAVLNSGDKVQVYLVKSGKALLKDVELGKRLQNEVVIKTGVNAGDTLVTSGFVNLFNGANIIANK